MKASYMHSSAGLRCYHCEHHCATIVNNKLRAPRRTFADIHSLQIGICGELQLLTNIALAAQLPGRYAWSQHCMHPCSCRANWTAPRRCVIGQHNKHLFQSPYETGTPASRRCRVSAKRHQDSAKPRCSQDPLQVRYSVLT